MSHSLKAQIEGQIVPLYFAVAAIFRGRPRKNRGKRGGRSRGKREDRHAFGVTRKREEKD